MTDEVKPTTEDLPAKPEDMNNIKGGYGTVEAPDPNNPPMGGTSGADSSGTPPIFEEGNSGTVSGGS